MMQISVKGTINVEDPVAVDATAKFDSKGTTSLQALTATGLTLMVTVQ